MAFLVYRELVLEHTLEPSGDHVEIIDEVRSSPTPPSPTTSPRRSIPPTTQGDP